MVGLLLWRFAVVGLMLWVESELEGCRGGFVCVSVCFAWWFDWQWWIGMWVSSVYVFCLVGLLVATMMEVFFFLAWVVGLWWLWYGRWVVG